MKTIMRNLTAIVMMLLLFAAVGCGGGGETGGTETGTTQPIANNTLFYAAVQEVMPTFEPQGTPASVSKAVPTAWESGNPLHEVFYILREFDPETDQGDIDTSNLYKTMWEARGYFSSAKSECTAIAEQEIAPPFDLGNAATTYNCAYNETDAADGYNFGKAIKELDEEGNIIEITEESRESTSAAVRHGLFGFVWPDVEDPTHNELGVIQGVLNDTTDDLSVDIAVWVDYEGASDYCYRNDIDGNTETHAFTFKSIKGNLVEGSTSISIVGKGVSQGEGEHFLLKIAASGLDSPRYYCIGAGDGEEELMAMSAEGSVTVDEDCAEYEDAVDAMTAFTTDDLACQSSDFNSGGGIGEAQEGTIYLGFTE